jgi:hypothetical protein
MRKISSLLWKRVYFNWINMVLLARLILRANVKKAPHRICPSILASPPDKDDERRRAD